MKKLSLKTQMQLYITMVWIGAVVALLSRVLGPLYLWIGISIVVAGTICRYTLIRCPHCGHKFLDGNKLPYRCPNCEGELQ